MIASDVAPSTPVRHLRRSASKWATVVVVALIGALAAWSLAPFLMAPPWRMVGWQFQGYGRPVADTAAISTTIEVYVASWPTEYRQGDASWLEQTVIETPWTVTIALHTSDAYDAGPAMRVRGWYDTGGWVTVHPLAPLGGRMLFDGSAFPPPPRW